MLTDRQQEIQQQAIEFAQRELTGDAGPDHFDRDGWERCGRFGAMGVTVPETYGGKGESLAEFVAMMEGLGYASRRLGLLFAINAHVFGAVEPIRHAGTPEQQARHLPKLASGEWVAAHGVTEPEGGSDPAALQTTAARTDDGWVLHGVKHCITCASHADFHVVYARIAEGGGLGCFLIEPGTPGITLRPQPAVGLTGCGLGQISYEQVKIPGKNMLGDAGSGSMVFQGSIERERACIFGFVVGAMRRELELAIEYANTRSVGGQAIAGHQAISHRIVDMATRLEAARLLLYQVTERKARGMRAPLQAAMTKLLASESFLENSVDLMRVFGGNGFMTEGGVEQFTRDALGGILFSGTSDIMRNIVAAHLGLKI